MDELTIFDGDKIKKGMKFEKFLREHLLKEFDKVLMTEKYDMGVDLICYNESNKEHRVGIQAKNFEREIRKKDISGMIDQSKQIYYLSEVRLYTTSSLNSNAEIFCQNRDIEFFEHNDIQEMIHKMNKLDQSKKDTDNNHNGLFDEMDLEEAIYSVRENLAEMYGYEKPHRVFTKKSVDDLLLKQPITNAELKRCFGFGKDKTEWFGEEICNLFIRYSEYINE